MEIITLDEYVNCRKKKGIANAITLDEYLAQRGTKPQTNNTEERTWFQKGLFEDGYQFGDVTKSILATRKDAEENFNAGILGMGEKVVDAGAYVAGAVGGLFGADKFRNNMQEFIKKDLYDEQALAKKMTGSPSNDWINKILGLKSETDSVFGEKTDALVQSGGQLAATAGLQYLGVPWWVTTGTTSFGGEAEGALNQGASFMEAGSSALITAGADILTEKLFGGSGLGEKVLFPFKPLAEKISGKALKTLVKYGVDVVGEGAEEAVSSALSKLGTSLYKEENIKELLFSEEAVDEYIESIIGGVVLGGGMNAGKAVKSLKTGRDYDTGLTANEQKVVTREVENRIAEKETGGKKLTAKEKAAIEKQVKNDLQKGYISIDAIESALGGETYKSYKSITEQENALKKEIEALENTPLQQITVKQSERLEEARKQLKELDTNAVKEKLSKEVDALTGKDSFLRESYNEKGRRSQAFEVDVTKYDTKQQEVIKRAAESGILNNTNRTHEFVDMIAKISADKGVLFDFTNNEKLKESGFALDGRTVNGYVKDGNVTLNINSNKALNAVVGHEITHVLEGTDLYAELQQAVKEYASTKGEYDTRLQALSKLYDGVEGATIENELTADLIGDYLFTDEAFVRNLSTQNRNLFQKIYDEIKYLYKVVTAGSKEAKELEKVKKVFDETFKKAASLTDSRGSYDGSSIASNSSIQQTQQNATQNNEKYSLSGTNDETTPTGDYKVRGKDILFDAPVDTTKIPAEATQTLSETAPPVEDESESGHIAGEDLTRKNADRIRAIQSEVKGYRLTKDVTKEDFAKKIVQKESEYESLKRKDTKKAMDLRNQITSLEKRRDSLLRELDNKIERANNRIEKIEKDIRYEKRKTKEKQYREMFGGLMGDTSTWVDKKLGIQYQMNTLRRNLRDIVRDEKGNRDIQRADAIYNELQGSVNRNEANKNREANNLKNVFREMKINNAESTYIQMLGELRHNPDTTLTKDVVDAFYQKNKDKIDTQKVEKVIDEARKLYDSLYDRVNAALSEHGFKEMGYRKGYFPHFTDSKQNWLAKLLNWKVQNDEIPTDIAGITEFFEPQRTYQSFDKHRTSDITDYNFLKGLDNYVNGALDWIYHIEDIQKHRAFETEIRYRHSSEQVQKKIDEYRNNPMLSAEEVDTLIENTLRQARNPLNNFVTDLHTRTNILAGKKSSKDRGMESDFNRHAYSIMTNVTNRVTANQVVGSISSAVTNFIPITQSWGQVRPSSSLVGMKKTIQSYMSDDGVIEKSDFLTNRLAQNEALYKDAWDKIGDKVGGLMEIVDNFTSQTVWRSKYYENINAGMTEAQAIKDADQFAENVIGGRSKGNQPTIFHAKNPVTKMLTAFQLEVANQYGYMFKDMPQEIGKEAIGKLTKGYATMFVGAYVFNALYSSLTGRDAAFDPIGIIEELIRDLAGDEDEEDKVANAISGLASNIAEEIPFVGGLLGGGRIPISSALPYNASISDAYADVVDGDWKSILDEMSKPFYYGLMPMGGGQLRKTVQGLSMFDKDLPVSGSYTKSGNLRFPVEDTVLNKFQAALFGQYASKNARDYFDNERQPLEEERIEEYASLDIPIKDYWEYRDGLKKQKTVEQKFDYIAGLDFPVAKKNIMINNAVKRKEKIDLTDYSKYGSYAEFDFAIHYPGQYAVSKAIADNVEVYKRYLSKINDITADKDESGESISGSRKEKVINYLNDLNIDYGKKIILFKNEYPADDSYNEDIIEYLNGRKDLKYEDLETILKELDFTVEADGTVRW